jgi:hypothetical protein
MPIPARAPSFLCGNLPSMWRRGIARNSYYEIVTID